MLPLGRQGKGTRDLLVLCLTTAIYNSFKIRSLIKKEKTELMRKRGLRHSTEKLGNPKNIGT